MLISLEKDQNKIEDKARLKVRIMTSVSYMHQGEIRSYIFFAFWKLVRLPTNAKREWNWKKCWLREKKSSSTSIVSWPLNSATDPKVSAPLLPCTSCEGSRDRVLSACMIGTWCFRCFCRLRLLHIPLRVNCELNQRKWDKLKFKINQQTCLNDLLGAIFWVHWLNWFDFLL